MRWEEWSTCRRIQLSLEEEKEPGIPLHQVPHTWHGSTLHKHHTPSWLARSRCPGSSPCTLGSNFPEDELDSTSSRELHLRRRERRNRCRNQRTSDTIRRTRSPRSSPSRQRGYNLRGKDADRCHSISPPPPRWLLLRTLCRRSSGCKARLAPPDQSWEDLP